MVPVEGRTGTGVVSLASTVRDEMAVSGQRLPAASAQIPIAAHTAADGAGTLCGGRERGFWTPSGHMGARRGHGGTVLQDDAPPLGLRPALLQPKPP